NPRTSTGVFYEVEAYNADLEDWTSLEPMVVPRHGIGVGAIGNAMSIPGGAVFEGYGATGQSDFLEVREDLLLPQYVAGGGYSTEIVMTNPSVLPESMPTRGSALMRRSPVEVRSPPSIRPDRLATLLFRSSKTEQKSKTLSRS